MKLDLFIKEHFVADDLGTIIIVHGFCEHSQRYLEFIKNLNAAKFSVVTYDLRGHGQSGGEKGKIDSYLTHLNDLTYIVSTYKDRKNLVLFGHSMGGLIVSLYLSKNDNIKNAVLSGAVTNHIKMVSPFKHIGLGALSWISLKNDLANESLALNPDVVKGYNADPLVLKRFYLGLINQMFIKGVKVLNKNISKINANILLIHGKKDGLVPTNFSARFIDLIKSKDKTLIVYENSAHEVLNDLEKEKATTDVISWLTKHALS